MATQQAPAPQHDATAADAIVLNESEWARGEGKDGNGRPVVAVVVDPYLGRHVGYSGIAYESKADAT